ncbi:MAG TPA: hypothetical protein VGR94_05375 [Candidatus Acidoferrales bacterium]|nr:hypothetical protein [Candidatus Acidoferrales bacterium]
MTCVYTRPQGQCDGIASLSKSEHYLPRALGNFRGDERLVDRICDSCQARFGQLEDMFAHNSAEAFFREMVGRVGRKNHRGKNIFYEPTLGIPPLTVLGKPDGLDVEILWELVAGTTNCQPVSQIVLIGEEGKCLQIPFRRGRLTAESIRTILKERAIECHQILTVCNSAEEAEEMQVLTDELAPKGEPRESPMLTNGIQMAGEMRAPISAQYLRAIAKIAFHFFLRYFTQFSGLEDEFEDIKQFIYTGVAKRLIVSPLQEPFVRDLQGGARMNRWGHLLSAECSYSGIEARLQFFAGPQVQPIVWRCSIGKNPARIIYKQAVGYAYLYFEDVGGEYQGERVELTPIGRIAIAPTPPRLRLIRI